MFEKKAQELRKKIDKLETIGNIYEKIKDMYNWDCCEWHGADEEHSEVWFTEKSDDMLMEYEINRKEAYKDVLKMIEKMVEK